LVTATKKDSQGLCFLGKVDVKDFLSHYVKSRPGNVMNEKGEVVGRHIGAIFYTIGERHGFTITKKTPTDKPYYIFAKDIKKNTVSVSEKTAEGLLPKSLKVLMLENVNWIGEAPALGRKISGRIRYRADLENCRLTKINLKKSSATVAFDKPVLSATSGQSLVLYDGETCLGGGVIR
jgi:tRNA-specific 2-thiouridylase